MSTNTKISDELWDKISSLLPHEKTKNTVGRSAIPFRIVLDGILYVLRTGGCQWKMPPKEFGYGSTCHSRRFQRWVQVGIFKKIWARLLKEYDHKIGIKFTWQSIDSISIKSPLVGTVLAIIPPIREAN
jgi:transposase